jgi:hypothetical protein
MEHTYEAKELMRLFVPGSDGSIKLKVRVEDGGQSAECRWLTITFEQFAQIQNVLDNL